MFPLVFFSDARCLLHISYGCFSWPRRCPGRRRAWDADSSLVGRPDGAGSLWGGAGEASYLMLWLKLEPRRPLTPQLKLEQKQEVRPVGNLHAASPEVLSQPGRSKLTDQIALALTLVLLLFRQCKSCLGRVRFFVLPSRSISLPFLPSVFLAPLRPSPLPLQPFPLDTLPRRLLSTVFHGCLSVFVRGSSSLRSSS